VLYNVMLMSQSVMQTDRICAQLQLRVPPPLA